MSVEITLSAEGFFAEPRWCFKPQGRRGDRKKWCDSHKLMLGGGRVFVTVRTRESEADLVMDVVTGSLYDTFTRKCKSSDSLTLPEHIVLKQVEATEQLMSMKVSSVND